jgi:hypothetical protein
MAVHMGRFHMLYNGIPNWPHPLSVGWATSTDGRVWERRSESPVFAPDPVPHGGWTVRATSVLVEDDRWILYFVVGGEGRLEGVVGRATAPGPEGPWTVDAEPVFEPGGPGAWDAEAIGHAKVMPDAGGYVMYYTGWGEGPTRIGRAVSADGIAWTRDEGPVLEPPIGESATEDFQVSDPTVARTGDGRWLMVHRISRRSGHVAIGVAESDDGIRWTIDPAGPVTGLGPDSPLGMIFFNNMLATHTHQLVYFEGQSGGGTDVWAAVRTSYRPRSVRRRPIPRRSCASYNEGRLRLRRPCSRPSFAS